MAHAMFRSDNMEGTKDGKFLVNLYIDVDGGLDNGCVVKVGGLRPDEREIRDCLVPAAGDPIDDIAILGSEEVCKDRKYNGVGDFTNEKGAIARGYKLVKGDFFAVTADALEADEGYAFVAGTTICELQAGTKLKVADNVTEGSTKVGVLEAVEHEGAIIWLVFRVV